MIQDPGPVVFVHGLKGTLHVPNLLEDFPAGKALAPDLLGYGSLSDVPSSEIGMRAQVAHLHRTVERYLGTEPIHPRHGFDNRRFGGFDLPSSPNL